ncbi:hypothetical protein [Pseudolysinimonas yzui]|nr:hypothetical protein [Pseudolysinimonas yzui]
MAPYVSREASGRDIGGQSPTRQRISRFYAEKRGFLLMLLSRHTEARESYDAALILAAGDARGEAKVVAGRALVAFQDGRIGEAIRETEVAIARASDVGAGDVRLPAIHNLEVMRAGGTALRPYEIL